MVAFLPQLAVGTSGIFSWPISGIFPKTSPAGLSPSKPIEIDTGSLASLCWSTLGPYVLPGHPRPLPAHHPLLVRPHSALCLPTFRPPSFLFSPTLDLLSYWALYPNK